MAYVPTAGGGAAKRRSSSPSAAQSAQDAREAAAKRQRRATKPKFTPPYSTGKGKANSDNPRSPTSVNKGRGYVPSKTNKGRPGAAAGAAAGKAAGKAHSHAPVVAGSPAAPPPAPPVRGGGAVPPSVGGGGFMPGMSATASNAPATVAPSFAPAPTGSGTATGGPQTAHALAKYFDKGMASISAEDLPFLNELARQLDRTNRTYERERTETEQFGQRQQSDLAELFGRLGNFTQGVQTQNNSQYDQLRGATGNAYGNLTRAIGGHFDTAGSSVNNELARIGMEGQAPNATADITRDKAFLQALSTVDGTNAVNNMAFQQQGFNQLMDMARNTAATEGSVRVGQAKRDLQKILADLMFQKNEQVYDLEGKRGDRIATQGQRARELADVLENRDYSRTQEQRQQAFTEWLQKERLGLDRQQVVSSIEQARAAMSAPPSELDQIQVAQAQANLEKTLKELSAPPKGAKPQVPQKGTDAYVRHVLHSRMNRGQPGDDRNMTDAYNIYTTLRDGRYDDVDGKWDDGRPHAGKFSTSDPVTLKHLRDAVNRRWVTAPPAQKERIIGIIIDMMKAGGAS